MSDLTKLQQLVAPPPVANAQEYVAAINTLKSVKASLKQIKDKRDEMMAPAREIAQTADEWFGETKDALLAAEVSLKRVITEYIDQAVRRSSEETKAAIDEGNFELMLQRMSALPQVDGIKISNVVDYTVEDLDLVPDEYRIVSVDSKKILTDLRKGVDIPGIRKRQLTRLSVGSEK